MKYGRFDLHGHIFFGRVEGDSVVELDGSPFDTFRATTKRHALESLKALSRTSRRKAIRVKLSRQLVETAFKLGLIQTEPPLHAKDGEIVVLAVRRRNWNRSHRYASRLGF